MTALQRAEVRHLKWKIDECLYTEGYALLSARDPEVQEALKKFYLQEGFQIVPRTDGKLRIAPIGWVGLNQSDFNLNSL